MQAIAEMRAVTYDICCYERGDPTDQPVQWMNINVSALKGNTIISTRTDTRDDVVLDKAPVFMTMCLDRDEV